MRMDFFHNLSPFSQFEEFTRSENYYALLDDWLIMVADIKNSTLAIENGLYKEVNLIGAACITQAMQATDIQYIPFVFGGFLYFIDCGDGGLVMASRQLKLQMEEC